MVIVMPAMEDLSSSAVVVAGGGPTLPVEQRSQGRGPRASPGCIRSDGQGILAVQLSGPDQGLAIALTASP